MKLNLLLFFRNLFSDHRKKVRMAVQITQALKKAVDSKEGFFIESILPKKIRDRKLRSKLSTILATILRALELTKNYLRVSVKDAGVIASNRKKNFSEIAGRLLVAQTGIDLELAKQQCELEYQTNKEFLS